MLVQHCRGPHSAVTYCRIRNTMELVHVAVSENLVPAVYPYVKVVSEPFEAPLDANGDLRDFHGANELPEDAGDFEEAEPAGAEMVRG